MWLPRRSGGRQEAIRQIEWASRTSISYVFHSYYLEEGVVVIKIKSTHQMYCRIAITIIHEEVNEYLISWPVYDNPTMFRYAQWNFEEGWHLTPDHTLVEHL
jgi:hypothetical protein